MVSFRFFVSSHKEKALYESELCNSNLNIEFVVFTSAHKDSTTRCLLDEIFINLFSIKYSTIFAVITIMPLRDQEIPTSYSSLARKN